MRSSSPHLGVCDTERKLNEHSKPAKGSAVTAPERNGTTTITSASMEASAQRQALAPPHVRPPLLLAAPPPAAVGAVRLASRDRDASAGLPRDPAMTAAVPAVASPVYAHSNPNETIQFNGAQNVSFSRLHMNMCSLYKDQPPLSAWRSTVITKAGAIATPRCRAR